MRDMADTDTLVLIERERADCYRLLSACFEGLFSDLVGLTERLCPDAAGFLMEMREAFGRYDAEELAVDYAKLFVGPFELKAPPYGSVYLDNERRVMGESTMEVIRAYGEAGLSVDEGFREVPDHIAAELEFMHYLASKAAEERGSYATKNKLIFVSAQKRFMDKLLGPWVPAFCELIKRESSSAFYRALAGSLEAFIRCDCEYLGLERGGRA
jgi:TorA maturation chaperone TorD